MPDPTDPTDGRAPLRLAAPSPRPLPERSGAAARRARARMVELPGGTFDMGSEDADVVPGDGEGPVRPVTVAPFRVAPTTVTNADFDRFVKATGYRTQAEEFGWSYVFHLFTADVDPAGVRGTAGGTPWWLAVDGASWRHPDGPRSSLWNRRDHPVVHVSREDALAYCAWSGTRLPSEAEWEYAARGGLQRARFPWGDELEPGGKHMCNIWQGVFPDVNTAADGHVGTAPAKSYPANGYGLYNVAGNVWEWTSSPWDATAHDVWVIRGGSYLCHASYCNRYRVAARTRNTGDSSSGNTGFRVVADPDPADGETAAEGSTA
ncbi:formylglycine-generating enzyme family protein [Georgenia alba]|uniref:Formylglycine-generating enzyme family protein n=1 Tax=Georgenia alba TaxID=2233858 RepID=A0ABW2Q3J0_9MICO